ncbi:MAG: hypothetical protein ACOYNL_06890 [Rickettsiales bacterium]
MRISQVALPFSIALLLSSCAYLIPPDTNEPRHNTVLGAPHKPQLNVTTIGVGPQSNNTVRDTMQVAPQQVAAMERAAPVTAVTRSDLPNLPPVDPSTRAQAEREMASVSERRIPMENQFQVAANDYPDLHSVPARPTLNGPGSTQSRLIETKSYLEQDRTQSEISKAALSRDAAAEPSMLSELPATEGTIPPNDPVVSLPMSQPVLNPIPAPALAPATIRNEPVSSLRVTHPEVVTNTYTAPRIVMQAPTPPPPSPNFAPPAPLGALPETQYAPAPATIAYAPKASVPVVYSPLPINANAQYAPAVTSVPVVAGTAVATRAQEVAIAELPAPAVTRASTARRGDFDPLAVADNAPITTHRSRNSNLYNAAPTDVSNGYIAPSRYADRRY